MQTVSGVRLVALSGVPVAVGASREDRLEGASQRFTFEMAGAGPRAAAGVELLTLDEAQLEGSMGWHLCAMADPASRRLHVLMRKEVVGVLPALASRLQPRCVSLGHCDLPENADGRCRVRPHRSSLGLVPSAAGAVMEAAAP